MINPQINLFMKIQDKQLINENITATINHKFLCMYKMMY